MAICKFFQMGQCVKGSRCDFEHINRGGLPRSNTGELAPEQQRRRSERRPSQPQPQTQPRAQVSKSQKNKKKATENKAIDANARNPPNRRDNSSPRRDTTNTNSITNVKYNTNPNNSNKPSPSYKKKNKKNKPYNKNISTPTTNTSTTTPGLPSIKDFVDMVMTDLASRPTLWHFSSYGLTLNSTQSLPFPVLGTTELSPEELRLQVYAEAAATGGRIENYVNVVNQIKNHAETVTKALIPSLEDRLLQFLKEHGIPLDKKDILKQELLSRRATDVGTFGGSASSLPYTNNYTNQQNNTLTAPYSSSYDSLQQQQQQGNSLYPTIQQQQHQQQHTQNIHHQPQQPLLPQHSNIQSQHSASSHQIIPDSEFSFGMIPEMPPE